MDEQRTPQKETPKFDGISAQINLSPGSETHRRFAEMMRQSGAMTARSFVEMLMDAYAYPKVDTDNSEVIAKLQSEKEELDNTCHNQEVTIAEQKEEIADLKEKLEAANNTANENAVNGLGKQAQIEELQKQMEGAIIVKPNPVSAYFLKEMAEKTNTTPAKILEKLFFEDLQNPLSDHLPYTVSSSRIRKVMEDLKPKDNA